MSDDQFKTPKTLTKKMRRDTPFKTPLNHYKRPNTSGSDESSSGTESVNGEENLSLVTLYDDLYRKFKQQMDSKVELEKSYLCTMEEVKLMWLHWKNTSEEFERLQELLSSKTQEISELERNLKRARCMLDEEKKKRKQAEVDLDEQLTKISMVMNTLGRDNYSNLNDIKMQLASLNPYGKKNSEGNHLSAIQEINSTGSILSDFSYSQSEDDLDTSLLRTGKSWRKMKKSCEPAVDEPVQKKRRPSSGKSVHIGQSETVRATTTVTVSKEGPIKATSVIESVPVDEENNIAPPNLVFESWAKQNETPTRSQSNINSHQRQHMFQQKTIVMLETCFVCEKRLRFGKTAARCKECKAYCHLECKSLLPLPCIPMVNTPNGKKAAGTISDYTPTTPPMVPSLMVICINEIEQRGMHEMGIYRIPGSEKEVKGLKERLLSARGPINLKDVDIHVICCCIKDFLRSLAEPLVTILRLKDFIEAVNAKDQQDVFPALYQAIAELPQPNRDSLAYLILHLQRVTQSPESKMPIENIAKIFGPTVIGYTSDDLNSSQLIQETRSSIKVMECFLNMPSNYWSSFIEVYQTSGWRLQQTPSTDSLLKSTTPKCFTPSVGKIKKTKGKIFSTPPTFRN